MNVTKLYPAKNLLAASILCAMWAQNALAFENFLVNPQFEIKGNDGRPLGWNMPPGSGLDSSNPMLGNHVAYLDPGAANSLSQTITIPTSGDYDVSFFARAVESGGKVELVVNGVVKARIDIVKSTNIDHYQPYRFDPIQLAANQQLTVRVLGAPAGWLNVDGFVVQKSASRLQISASDAKVDATFKWAKANALTYVQTNADASFIPSYWAGYGFRQAFYGRDTVHQMLGAHLLGLGKENLSMMKTFAASATSARKYYPIWAFDFSGNISSKYGDYADDTVFVRELPTPFEMVEKSYQQYMWSANSEWINSPTLTQFYNNTVTNFVQNHDANNNGIADDIGINIWLGAASYNEFGEKLREAADALGAQYQAYLAYSKIMALKGQTTTAQTYNTKASQLLTAFRQDWWSSADGHYIIGKSSFDRDLFPVVYELDSNGARIQAVDSDGRPMFDTSGNPIWKENELLTHQTQDTSKWVRKSGWAKETSFFIPLKLISEPGTKTTQQLNHISSNINMGNIEAYTYLPEVFWPHGQIEAGWKWLQHYADSRDNYPELSYTYIGHLVGLMGGVSPNAPSHKVNTLPALPKSIAWLNMNALTVGAHTIDVVHTGNAQTTLAHKAGNSTLSWRAQFSGAASKIYVDGISVPVTQFDAPSGKVSYADVSMAIGRTATAQVPGIFYHSSGKCITAGIAPTNNALLQFTDACTVSRDGFVLLPNKLLQHVGSGLCVNPQGGTVKQDAKLMLSSNCVATDTRVQFAQTKVSSLQHFSTGLCVHPNGGSANPANGTTLVYYPICGEERLKFFFNPTVINPLAP